ncbi:5822_t:CDS:2 [Gigaspora margarita]|uniref:5822_t:CDS:1 n=1 Tax=Gigaspora margarita TaxID=4874 RepID=A0ABM8VXW7_GIGMA|nr:5822_t:CDS:2 [Gigaspora margarita]
MFQVNTIFEIEPLEHNEQLVTLTSNLTSPNNNILQPVDQNDLLPNIQTYSTRSEWFISAKMRKIMDNFENHILTQFPCIPCSICSKLMYPEESLWIQRDSNFSYPLANYLPLVTNPNPPKNRIAICSLCKSNQNRNYSLYLFPIPLGIDLNLFEKYDIKSTRPNTKDLLNNYQNYQDYFLARFSDLFQLIQQQNYEYTLRQTTHALDQFNNLIETIILSLQSILTINILDIIKIQLDSIKILPQIITTNSIINLPPSQYYCLQTIINYLGL